jgi:hypothetical protein
MVQSSLVGWGGQVRSAGALDGQPGIVPPAALADTPGVSDREIRRSRLARTPQLYIASLWPKLIKVNADSLKGLLGCDEIAGKPFRV